MRVLKNGFFVSLCVSCIFCFAMGSAYAQDATETERRAEKTALIVTEDYIIGPEDVLEISVWRNQDLSREVVVRPDGRITLPLIGDVKAVGRTTQELKDEITQRLSAYKESPTIAIVVKAVNSYYYYVQGAIGKSGRLPLLSRTTLVQAITLAGGLTPDAVRSRIVIFRIGLNGDDSNKLTVNYDDIILRGAENVVIKPGDTIVVPSETMVLLP
ncbi:MAG: polysaccharide biosynthesis/export family protein [Nitrospirales bacterium]|nr:polysaccharide biosynthesis/export family protein [Nitrospira sp.]MDR4501884.1 polysaccharide biosynthesis/export family protein [Nitrospirales bacterium]